MVRDVIDSTLACDYEQISMSVEVLGALEELRTYMFQNMYLTPTVRGEFVKAQRTLTALFEHVIAHPESFSIRRAASRWSDWPSTHRRHDRPLRNQPLRAPLRPASVGLNPRAVIFDMDGLLLDSEPLYRVTWKAAGSSLGFPIDDVLYERFVGRGNMESELILREHFGDAFPFDEFHTRWSCDFNERLATSPLPPKPGVIELLDFLDARGIPKRSQPRRRAHSRFAASATSLRASLRLHSAMRFRTRSPLPTSSSSPRNASASHPRTASCSKTPKPESAPRAPREWT